MSGPRPTPAMLDRARAWAARFRDRDCEVVRTAPVDDGQGGWTPGPPSVVAAVTCAVVPRQREPTEALGGGAVLSEVLWDVHLPADTDVRPTDRVRNLPTDPWPERWFEVVGTGGPRTLEHERIVICREVQ